MPGAAAGFLWQAFVLLHLLEGCWGQALCLRHVFEEQPAWHGVGDGVVGWVGHHHPPTPFRPGVCPCPLHPHNYHRLCPQGWWVAALPGTSPEAALLMQICSDEKV